MECFPSDFLVHVALSSDNKYHCSLHCVGTPGPASQVQGHQSRSGERHVPEPDQHARPTHGHASPPTAEDHRMPVSSVIPLLTQLF